MFGSSVVVGSTLNRGRDVKQSYSLDAHGGCPSCAGEVWTMRMAFAMEKIFMVSHIRRQVRSLARIEYFTV